MLREVVNAVVLTFAVSEWLSERPGRGAATKALCAGLGAALLFVNFVGDHLTALHPAAHTLLTSRGVVATVEGAVIASGAYGTARATNRPVFCGVPSCKKGPLPTGAWMRMFVVNFLLCYVRGGLLTLIHVPRFIVAALAFLGVLYLDIRRTVEVNPPLFLKEVARSCAYVAPLYPLLAILCSLIFVPIMSVFDKAGWSLRSLDAPIFYTVFYGPFSAVYVLAKRALLAARCGLPVSVPRARGHTPYFESDEYASARE